MWHWRTHFAVRCLCLCGSQNVATIRDVFITQSFVMTNCYKMKDRQQISMPMCLFNLSSGCRSIKYGAQEILFSPHVFCIVFMSQCVLVPLRPPSRSSLGKTSSFPVISLVYSGSLSTSCVPKLIYTSATCYLAFCEWIFCPFSLKLLLQFPFFSELHFLQLKHACISSKSSPNRMFRGNSQGMHSVGTRIESRPVHRTALLIYTRVLVILTDLDRLSANVSDLDQFPSFLDRSRPVYLYPDFCKVTSYCD